MIKVHEQWKLNSQVCTSKIQSERLLALGLKKETADMYYSPFYFENNLIDYFDAKVLGGSVREEMMAGYEEYKDYIPAWSLHRLILLLDTIACDWIFRNGDCYTNAINGIEWLIKKGYFNKEYLD